MPLKVLNVVLEVLFFLNRYYFFKCPILIEILSSKVCVSSFKCGLKQSWAHNQRSSVSILKSQLCMFDADVIFSGRSTSARFNWVAHWLAYIFDLLRHIFNVRTTIVVVMGKCKFSDSWVQDPAFKD